MSEHACVVCGTLFVASWKGRRTTCSESCRTQRDRDIYGAKRARHFARHPRPRQITRWTSGEKARLVEAVKTGATTKDQACSAHGISDEEFEAWARDFTARGADGLRIKSIKEGRIAPC